MRGDKRNRDHRVRVETRWVAVPRVAEHMTQTLSRHVRACRVDTARMLEYKEQGNGKKSRGRALVVSLLMKTFGQTRIGVGVSYAPSFGRRVRYGYRTAILQSRDDLRAEERANEPFRIHSYFSVLHSPMCYLP